MIVRIIKNKGNFFYDQYIDREFEATKSAKGVYTISGVPTKDRLRDHSDRLVGTQWFRSEVKEMMH